MQTYTVVNSTGLEEIHRFILSNHKYGASFNASMIKSLVDEVDDLISGGDDPVVTIAQEYSNSGLVEAYTVSEAGLETDLAGE